MDGSSSRLLQPTMDGSSPRLLRPTMIGSSPLLLPPTMDGSFSRLLQPTTDGSSPLMLPPTLDDVDSSSLLNEESRRMLPPAVAISAHRRSGVGFPLPCSASSSTEESFPSDAVADIQRFLPSAATADSRRFGPSPAAAYYRWCDSLSAPSGGSCWLLFAALPRLYNIHVPGRLVFLVWWHSHLTRWLYARYHSILAPYGELTASKSLNKGLADSSTTHYANVEPQLAGNLLMVFGLRSRVCQYSTCLMGPRPFAYLLKHQVAVLLEPAGLLPLAYQTA